MIIIDTRNLETYFNEDLIKEIVGAYFTISMGCFLGSFNTVDEIRTDEWNMQYKRNLYRVEFDRGVYTFHYLKEM